MTQPQIVAACCPVEIVHCLQLSQPPHKNLNRALGLQAHTCGNILELPNYQESILAEHNIQEGHVHEQQLERMLLHIVNDRLLVAVRCTTYGLDEK